MLDRFDVLILEIWQKWGDIGPQGMSEKVHLSASQCSRRMQRLRSEGYVQHIAAVLDAAKIGIGVHAYILLTLHSHSAECLEQFRQKIMDMDEVSECQTLTGISDVILKVSTYDLNSFNHFLNHELLSLPEVSTAHSNIVLSNIKSSTNFTLKYSN
ncbi:Lrp/AsnC family transcriptional regulator [Neokomagataea thailandica]|uniref:AsnC family transcriptional regulator n=1 Tax=Neokomagataea tanensis NBRC 106556 TaxID=1223519 RepID=A0ABQ0QKX3_9PROT|nr:MULTISPECIES: Lrp/AsnC family transcriptional regulator [Neokomagataea]GBR48504.1 AsnC family transcriptional regulator [Neokomagataea tanensis NBRC 106556]